MKEHCKNHPAEAAISFCHSCHEYYCSACLIEGVEYYYCYKSDCQRNYRQDVSRLEIDCLNCGQSIIMKTEEGVAGGYKCENCKKELVIALQPVIETKYRTYHSLEEINLNQMLLSLNTNDNAYLRLFSHANSGIEAVRKSRNEYSLSYHYNADNHYYESKRNDITANEVVRAFTGFLHHEHSWKETFEWQVVPLAKRVRLLKGVGKVIKVIWPFLFFMVLIYVFYWLLELSKVIQK